MNRYGVDIDKIGKKINIIFIAYLIAPLLYLFIAKHLPEAENFNPNQVDDTIIWTLRIVAVVTIIVGIWFRRYIFTKPMILSPESFGEDFTKNAFVFTTSYLAFFESIVIYGFVSYFINQNYIHLIVYAIITIILLIIYRPSSAFTKKVLDKQIKLVEEGKFKKHKYGVF